MNESHDLRPAGGERQEPIPGEALREAEEALAKSEERFRQLAELLPETVYEIDTTGRLTFVNRQAFEMFGYTRQDFEAGLNAMDMLAPTERERGRRGIQDVLEGVANPDKEYTALRKDGSTFPTLIFSSAILRDGRPAGLRGIIVDITERKQLEAQLRQSQKMEAVGRLAGGVAHDFNNLLTAILGYSELALARLQKDDPLAQDIDEIRKAGLRAALLTRQLLAFSRRQILQPETLDLNAVVADTEKLLRRLIGEDVHLVTLLDPAAGCIEADPGQLTQLIMNLAVNARDAMPRGGELTIETRNADVAEDEARRCDGARPGPHVLLAIADTGVGMDPTILSHLFEPFFTTKEVGNGTGLGPATVYGIVRQSGGHITVASKPGQGTTFSIYFPRTLDHHPDGVARPPRPISQGTETILLVEDEDAVRSLARAILHSQGYRVLEANGPGEALLVAQQHDGPIHLLLTDVVMPKMSGCELVTRLADLRPGLRILLISGYTDDALIRHGVLPVPAAFLQKPFSVEDLVRKVREALDTTPPSPGPAGAVEKSLLGACRRIRAGS